MHTSKFSFKQAEEPLRIRPDRPVSEFPPEVRILLMEADFILGEFGGSEFAADMKTLDEKFPCGELEPDWLNHGLRCEVCVELRDPLRFWNERERGFRVLMARGERRAFDPST